MVEPTKPQFYESFVDDIINKRYKGQPDILFPALISNHPNMKYIIEVDPDKLLYTTMIQESGIVTNEMIRKDRKLPVYWTFRIPKSYKRNSITKDFNRALPF